VYWYVDSQCVYTQREASLEAEESNAEIRNTKIFKFWVDLSVLKNNRFDFEEGYHTWNLVGDVAFVSITLARLRKALMGAGRYRETRDSDT
jgi:hypothetical protein